MIYLLFLVSQSYVSGLWQRNPVTGIISPTFPPYTVAFKNFEASKDTTQIVVSGLIANNPMLRLGIGVRTLGLMNYAFMDFTKDKLSIHYMLPDSSDNILFDIFPDSIMFYKPVTADKGKGIEFVKPFIIPIANYVNRGERYGIFNSDTVELRDGMMFIYQDTLRVWYNGILYSISWNENNKTEKNE